MRRHHGCLRKRTSESRPHVFNESSNSSLRLPIFFPDISLSAVGISRLFAHFSTEAQKGAVTYQKRTTAPRTDCACCCMGVAVGKDEAITLPRMIATHTSIISTPIRNLPPCGHFQRVVVVTVFMRERLCPWPVIDFVTMQGHVQVTAVALKGRRQGRG